MIGLEHAVAAYMHYQLAGGRIECRLKATPQITVAASDTTVHYDHSKSRAELEHFDIDTVSPYARGVNTHVGGLMSGEVSVSQTMRLKQETYPALNAGCLYIDRINVKIQVSPTIYIARDYPKDGCMYKAVREHELKHVEVDRIIVNQYTQIIANGLEEGLKKLGLAHGPFLQQRMPEMQKHLEDQLNKLLTHHTARMNAERRVAQQAVDTKEEYERVSALCRGRR